MVKFDIFFVCARQRSPNVWSFLMKNLDDFTDCNNMSNYVKIYSNQCNGMRMRLPRLVRLHTHRHRVCLRSYSITLEWFSEKHCRHACVFIWTFLLVLKRRLNADFNTFVPKINCTLAHLRVSEHAGVRVCQFRISFRGERAAMQTRLNDHAPKWPRRRAAPCANMRNKNAH